MPKNRRKTVCRTHTHTFLITCEMRQTEKKRAHFIWTTSAIGYYIGFGIPPPLRGGGGDVYPWRLLRRRPPMSMSSACPFASANMALRGIYIHTHTYVLHISHVFIAFRVCIERRGGKSKCVCVSISHTAATQCNLWCLIELCLIFAPHLTET